MRPEKTVPIIKAWTQKFRKIEERRGGGAHGLTALGKGNQLPWGDPNDLNRVGNSGKQAFRDMGNQEKAVSGL